MAELSPNVRYIKGIGETRAKALEKLGFRVWHHRRVSTNDEGIALGQLMIAQHCAEKS